MSVCSLIYCHFYFFILFFFNDTATTEIYTLSLHDALPIFARCFSTSRSSSSLFLRLSAATESNTERNAATFPWTKRQLDRKSTRLNSSHSQISYAVFCLKKKKKKK